MYVIFFWRVSQNKTGPWPATIAEASDWVADLINGTRTAINMTKKGLKLLLNRAKLDENREKWEYNREQTLIEPGLELDWTWTEPLLSISLCLAIVWAKKLKQGWNCMTNLNQVWYCRVYAALTLAHLHSRASWRKYRKTKPVHINQVWIWLGHCRLPCVPSWCDLGISRWWSSR